MLTRHPLKHDPIPHGWTLSRADESLAKAVHRFWQFPRRSPSGELSAAPISRSGTGPHDPIPKFIGRDGPAEVEPLDHLAAEFIERACPVGPIPPVMPPADHPRHCPAA